MRHPTSQKKVKRLRKAPDVNLAYPRKLTHLDLPLLHIQSCNAEGEAEMYVSSKLVGVVVPQTTV